MKTKKFTHKKIEKCKLSKKDIDTGKDRYAVILDCDGDEITSVGFYKTELLKDLIKGKGEKIKKDFMSQAKTISQNMFKGLNEAMGLPKQEEVYQVS